MNKNDISNVNNLQLTNTLNMNNRQIKYLQDGNENNDAVNIKQLNFFTHKPVYNTYSQSTSFKTICF